MTSRLSKFRMLVSSAVIFILIRASSSSSAAAKARCYWCGPLAEQVHRSQRAPSCSSFHLEPHETECDPGYSHCAIVATSPPYAESRLCVKFYQDECYSLYCNSTKTWRMVCACQGDLCNGPHTDRETEAFALVSKFPKNKSRNKRSLPNIQPKSFIGVKTKHAVEENTIIVMGKEPNDTQMLNDQPAELPIKEPSNAGEDIKTDLTPTPKKVEDNYMIVHGALTSVDKNNDITKADSHDVSKKDTEPTMPAMKDREDPKITNTQTESTKGDATNASEIDKNDDNVKTEKPNASVAANNQGEEKNNNHNKNTQANKDYSDINKNNAQIDKPEETTTKPPEMLIEKHDSITVTSTTKPTTIQTSVEAQTSATEGKKPLAENMQQNTTPTKAVDITTLGTVATTDTHIETTTPSKELNNTQKGSGVQNVVHVALFIICFLTIYCV